MSRLANQPTTRGQRLGDPVSLRSENIEDWMINTGDARYWGYTVRVLLKHIPIEQRTEGATEGLS